MSISLIWVKKVFAVKRTWFEWANDLRNAIIKCQQSIYKEKDRIEGIDLYAYKLYEEH